MIVALLAATVLLADVTPVASSAAAAPASKPVLGSRMPVKKCRTVGDAAAEKLEAQQALIKMQGDNTYSSK
jgi:hypothetical protein